MTEVVIHLGLSPRAAQALDELLEIAHMSFDGAPLDHVDDEDASSYFDAIRADIKEQMPKQKAKPKYRSKPTGVKKKKKR